MELESPRIGSLSSIPFNDRTFLKCIEILRHQRSPIMVKLIIDAYVPPAIRDACRIQCKLEGLI